MTEDEMQDYLELFDDDGNDSVYSFWDVRTDDKRLLFPSHDVVTVYRYILVSPLANSDQIIEARKMLGELTADFEDGDHRMVNQTPEALRVEGNTFLVAEVDWNALSAQRRMELLAGCGYWAGMWKKSWENTLPTVQVLLARELERISGGVATFVHNEGMEELRHQSGWEVGCDPRLTGEAGR